MDVSVVIVNWNAGTWLRECLQSMYTELHSSPLLTYQVFVVDNASSDGSGDMILSQFPQVHLIANSQNRGFAAANNQALQQAEGQFLLLLNPDTLVQPGAIKNLLNYMQENSRAGAVGPRIFNPDGSMQVSAHPFPTFFRETWRLFHLDSISPISRYPEDFFHRKSAQIVDVLMGACILLRREAIRDVGLFDEQFFIYSEEVDLCLRIHQAGWYIYWIPEAIITHYGGQSTVQIVEEMFLELYRNKVKFFRKHYGPSQTVAYQCLLAMAALPRWIGGKVMGFVFTAGREKWNRLAHNYRQLIFTLPGM